MIFQQDDLFKNSFGGGCSFRCGNWWQLSRESSTGSQSFVASEFSFKPKWLVQRIVLIFDWNIFIKFQLKCLGARRAPRNFNLGDHLLGLGTQAKTPGSPKGSLKVKVKVAVSSAKQFIDNSRSETVLKHNKEFHNESIFICILEVSLIFKS